MAKDRHFTSYERRNYFPENVDFEAESDELEKLLDAYDSAAANAERSARRAVQFPVRANYVRAIWNEAVCQTIERCLGVFAHTLDTTEYEVDEEVELPIPPEPEGI